MKAGVLFFSEARDAARHPLCAGCYALEIGAVVKIGASGRVPDRIAQVASFARNYSDARIGAAAIFGPAVDFMGFERALHRAFAARRVRRELFHVPLHEVLTVAEKLLPGFRQPASARASDPLLQSLVPGPSFTVSLEPAAPRAPRPQYPFWRHAAV